MEKRPVNLDFRTIHFPVPSVVSILHRLSGVVLGLCIPFLLLILQMSLQSEQAFATLKETISHPLTKSSLLLLIFAFLYHLIAGIRHLLMDIHVGETKIGGRVSAWIVLSLSAGLFLCGGLWLWSR